MLCLLENKIIDKMWCMALFYGIRNVGGEFYFFAAFYINHLH